MKKQSLLEEAKKQAQPRRGRRPERTEEEYEAALAYFDGEISGPQLKAALKKRDSISKQAVQQWASATLAQAYRSGYLVRSKARKAR